METSAQPAMNPSVLVAELNDLLQLDHDALAAYSIAIARIGNDMLRQTLREFRRDHERHVESLTQLIREQGGVAVQMPHVPTGAFKMAAQAVGALGGDRELLLAFKANERQARDKYRRAASANLPTAVREAVERGAQDEARHYAWVLETLEDLGAGGDSALGRAERVVEGAHARVADTLEGVEKGAMAAADTVRRGFATRGERKPIDTLLLAVGAGILAAQIFGREKR